MGSLWTDAMLEGRGDNFDGVSTDRLKLGVTGRNAPEVSWGPAHAPAGCGGHGLAANAKARIWGGGGWSRAQGRRPCGRCDSCRVTDTRGELVTSENSTD